ncbi:hypothetical protein J3492_04475 [Psychrobacter sp. F1192]|uniref:PepSY domain-containing protein n=1 Tax=Psychrobacter coccoides TaxID=2818440 RepID=A0ABS3NM35_9GAMM|nr:hypothetical protein [Psychrobacter coccoides]MBO1530469.1 hypothetical protein [Psychrobacter coccoides]
MTSKTLLKPTAAVSVIAALLTITTGCVTAPGYNAYDDLYEDIYKDSKVYKKHKKTIKTIDKDFYQPAIKQQAANRVSNMGYRVKSVKFKRGDSKIKVKATRGGEDYKIDLDYPSYQVIKIKED